MTVEWRNVAGFDGVYEVSNLGQVRRVSAGKSTWPGRVLKPRTNRAGYLHVALQRGSRATKPLEARVHRLVAVAFIPCPSDCGMVNHRDGNKANNAVENLEWATASQNTRHAVSSGLMVGLAGSRNGRSKLSAQQVRAIRAEPNTTSNNDLATKFGVSNQTISAIRLGINWQQVV